MIMAMKIKEAEAFAMVYESLLDKGFDGMAEAMEILLNHGMKIEREQHLNAQAYERSEERNGHANGFKPKTVKTRIGKLAVQVPQVRDSSFYPLALEKGLRSERAFAIALAEMYIKGLSTRKVGKLMVEMCGTDVSSTQVSAATKALDEEFEKWRNRKIGEILYLFVDARYEKVRMDGHVVSAALFTAIGVTADGKRTILGVSISQSEHEVHWRGFLEGLVARGMHGLKLIISDAHSGLKAARTAVFPTCPWQRCQFHLQQNAQAYVPRIDMRKSVAADIRYIFDAPNLEEAKRMLGIIVKKYEKTASKLAEWLAENVSETFEVFNFPDDHRKKIRTSNLIERLNKTIKKRTRIVGIFPNEDSCLRLATALLIEQDEEWMLEDIYMKINLEG